MKQYSSLVVVAVVALLLVVLLSSSIFVTIQPGEKGVIFRKFTSGLDKDNIYGEGFHVIAPWNGMNIYEVKEQKQEESMDVLDKSGLSIQVDVTVRFNPEHGNIGHLHENFGVDYVQRLVIPEVRSSVRKVMGRYTAEEIYSTKRNQVETEIIDETKAALSANYIDMRAMLIRSINLPEQIRAAIENKLEQEQEALAYQFRLDKEKSEAERKRIAAEGEARANEIINESLTPGLLRMRGIEATIKLSESENAKVVIIGSGADGMPLILGGQ